MGVSPGAAARHRSRTRVPTDLSSSFSIFSEKSEIGHSCRISDRGGSNTRDSNIRVRNALEAHKTLSDLKKSEKKKGEKRPTQL